jgi:hypothetical protein
VKTQEFVVKKMDADLLVNIKKHAMNGKVALSVLS